MKDAAIERRQAWQYIVCRLYTYLGGKVMTMTWVGFLVGLTFVSSPYFWQYIALFSTTLGALIAKASVEDFVSSRLKNGNGGTHP